MGILNLNNSLVAPTPDMIADPGELTIGFFQHTVIQVMGGRMPYKFAKESGPGEIDPRVGLFSADDEVGTAVIRVTDTLGDSTTVTIHIERSGVHDINYNGNGSINYSPMEGMFKALELTNDNHFVSVGTSEGDFLVAITDRLGEGDDWMGDDGDITIPVGVGGVAEAKDVILSDGYGLYIAGVAGSGTSNDFAMIKIDGQGTLDDSFGAGGKILTDFVGDDDGANAMIAQGDGKIILGGYAKIGPNMNSALARYTPEGELDTDFGPLENGKVVIPVAPGASPDIITSMIRLEDDEFMTVGKALIDGKQRVALMKFNADGTPDVSFGVGGRMITAIGARDVTATKMVYAEGRLYVTGYIRNNTSGKDEIIVLKYKLDGSFDETFSEDGWAVVRSPLPQYSAYGFSILVMTNGVVTIGGAMGNLAAGTKFPLMTRLRSNGRINLDYGTTGFVDFPDAGEGMIFD
ncbi:MAG TPA: hypothetical protein VJC18_04545, partial [bacterium]|nr:hypothetical protein [bacterium]